MDPHSLAQQILTVLRQNGYPEKNVRLPYRQLYRAAVDDGFSLDATLEVLNKWHRVDSQREEERIRFFPYVKPAPQIDSAGVDKVLRRYVRPVLKEAGFAKHKGRSTWRLSNDTACAIVFQSFKLQRRTLWLHNVFVEPECRVVLQRNAALPMVK